MDPFRSGPDLAAEEMNSDPGTRKPLHQAMTSAAVRADKAPLPAAVLRPRQVAAILAVVVVPAAAAVVLAAPVVVPAAAVPMAAVALAVAVPMAAVAVPVVAVPVVAVALVVPAAAPEEADLEDSGRGR